MAVNLVNDQQCDNITKLKAKIKINSFYILGYLLELMIKIWWFGILFYFFWNVANLGFFFFFLFSMKNILYRLKSYLSSQKLAKNNSLVKESRSEFVLWKHENPTTSHIKCGGAQHTFPNSILSNPILKSKLFGHRMYVLGFRVKSHKVGGCISKIRGLWQGVAKFPPWCFGHPKA
jgi:hypothetical protein